MGRNFKNDTRIFILKNMEELKKLGKNAKMKKLTKNLQNFIAKLLIK